MGKSEAAVRAEDWKELTSREGDIFATVFGPASGGAKTMARKIVAGMEARRTLAGIEMWRQRADSETDGTQP